LKEKQSRTRAFAERTKTVMVKGRVKTNNGVLTINSKGEKATNSVDKVDY